MRALFAGIEAGHNGAPVISCPYPSGDLCRSAWIRGYAKGGPESGSSQPSDRSPSSQ
ncbi:Rmf/CrpP fold protein [Streptomyces alboflavus]|uniref:Rmf/CrpP fold protein n=1 Tax=Streptomyces alboflavus TaxID=67267 RepID=UPI0036BC825C